MSKICVYAICKNEEKFVKQWIDSMSEADYIVVLDTGSTDNTVKLLKADKRVTKVVQKTINPWRFDVARNESLKLVPDDADILVCTDFDELFNQGWAQWLRDNWTPDTTRCYYTYAWSHNELGEPQDIFTYDKIHTRDYKWVFPVHEILAAKEHDFNEVVIDAGKSIYLHHWQDKNKDRKYYLDLLDLTRKENPDDSHAQMLYAREWIFAGDNKKAIQEFLTTLHMPDVDKPNKRLVLLNSLLQLAFLYIDEKNYDEAMWYCQEFIKEDPTYREPYIIMAELYNEMKMYTLAEACINAALEYSYRHYTWVERSTTFLEWLPDVESIAKFGVHKYKEACDLVEEALKHAPNNPRLLINQNLFLKTYIKSLTNN